MSCSQECVVGQLQLKHCCIKYTSIEAGDFSYILPRRVLGTIFQECNWDTIKGELFKVFQEFHFNGVINGRTNATLVYLISKKMNSVNIKDFRAISLVTCLYIVIAKVLSSRLSKFINTLISKEQLTLLGADRFWTQS